MRFAIAAAIPLLAWALPARAEIGDYPLREVDRPLVLIPGLAEFEARAGYADVPGNYDAEGRVARLGAGSVTSAAELEVAGRYGLFRAFEISFRAPWTASLATKAGTTQSGSGRARLGVAWTPPSTPGGADIALEGALVLPTTARVLRTDAAGVVHHDRLALAGSAGAKYRVAPDGAAHALAGFVFPFANADDRAADRNPPATFFVVAGSLFQLTDQLHADAAAGFTRTNRDRVAGGIVPRSDQFRVDLEPAIGFAPTRWYDLGLRASIPVAGKNTPQAFDLQATARARF